MTLFGRFVDYIFDDKNNKFPPVRSLFLFGGLLLYLLDSGLSTWVAYEYYKAKESDTDPLAVYYLTATLVFVIIPVLITNLLSWSLYTWGFAIYKSPFVRNHYKLQSERYYNFLRGEGLDISHLKKIIIWDLYRKRPLGSNNSSTTPNDGVELVGFVQHDKIVEAELTPTASVSIPLRKEREDSEEAPSLITNEDSCSKAELIGHSQDKVDTHRHSQDEVDTHRHSQDEVDTHRHSQDEVDTHRHSQDEVDTHRHSQDEVDTHVEFYALDLLEPAAYCVITILHLLMLGYEVRILRLFYKRKDDPYSFDRYRDLSFLRLLKSFMQSAPQLVLQMYVLVMTTHTTLIYCIITPVSIIVSMVSLALAVADYISASKDVNYYNPPPTHPRTMSRMSWGAYILLVSWHLAMISGRGTAFALFASFNGSGFLVFLLMHYVGMLFWMYKQHARVFVGGAGRNSRSRICRFVADPRYHLFSNYGIEFVVAVFNTFFHFKLNEISSLDSIVTFYTIAFVENSLLIFLWYSGKDLNARNWYDVPALAWVLGSFVVGLIFILAYYRVTVREPEETMQSEVPPTLTSSLNCLYRYEKPIRFVS